MLGVDDVLKFGASEGTCWLNGCWLLSVRCWWCVKVWRIWGNMFV